MKYEKITSSYHPVVFSVHKIVSGSKPETEIRVADEYFQNEAEGVCLLFPKSARVYALMRF